MDALQIQFKPTHWGRLYLVMIYLAALGFVLRDATPYALWFITPLFIVFWLEWRWQFSATAWRCSGIACEPSGAGQRLNQAWRIKLADEWCAVGEVQMYYQLPCLLAVKIIDYPQGRSRVLVIWRDMLDAQQWQLLRVYLSL